MPVFWNGLVKTTVVLEGCGIYMFLVLRVLSCFVMLRETSAAVSWWVVVHFWLVRGPIRNKYEYIYIYIYL